MAIKENNFMAFDGITVACMAHELHKNLSGGRISKIAQPETDELLLTIKSQEGNFRLLLSASASLPLVYLTQTNKPSPLTAPNFCMLLRKHISGRGWSVLCISILSIWMKWVISAVNF